MQKVAHIISSRNKGTPVQKGKWWKRKRAVNIMWKERQQLRICLKRHNHQLKTTTAVNQHNDYSPLYALRIVLVQCVQTSPDQIGSQIQFAILFSDFLNNFCCSPILTFKIEKFTGKSEGKSRMKMRHEWIIWKRRFVELSRRISCSHTGIVSMNSVTNMGRMMVNSRVNCHSVRMRSRMD